MKNLSSHNINHTQYYHSGYINLVQIFENIVNEIPKKTAIVFKEAPVSYEELNIRINQLAHFINKFEIEPNSCIAIYFERTIETVVSFLAIMKAGYTYLPLDIDSPAAMTKTILLDAKAPLILTTFKFSDKVKALTEFYVAKVIDLDAERDAINKENKNNLTNNNLAEVAYILYTSGSTGIPKGVQIAHRSIINLLFAMADEIDFTKTDVLLAITPLTFDLSVPDIFLPLIMSGSFVLAHSSIRFDPKKIIEHILKYNITVMQATPATWQMLIQAGWRNELKIKMICGGEGLSTWLAEKLIANKAHLWNFYGPTETTVWSTFHKVETINTNKNLIPIGKPILNTQVYVLNEQLQQQPPDTPGELYIGGDGVAVGYLNQPELNTQSFIQNPFLNLPNRLYKTGDIVTQSKDGVLHYVERADNQIKIRGHRIEVGAIEGYLLKYPGIKDSVVLDKNPDNVIELVAYIVLDDDIVSVNAIREYLKNYLPIYMIPSTFISVENFPLTPNGKINRKLIPSQKYKCYLNDKKNEDIFTHNTYQDMIVNHIKTFINVPHVNLDGNFFDLGMHSMMLVDLAAALSTRLKQDISAVDLFEHSSVRAFARYLAHKNKDSVHEIQKNQSITTKASEHNIAVIGISCKFPGSDSPSDFWQLILDKKASINFFTETELFSAQIPLEIIKNPNYVPARGILTDVDKFDATFFGYSPYEARITCPQHRIFLEQSWMALEDAGYISDTFSGKIGVFAGMNDSTYLYNNLLKNKEFMVDFDQQQMLLATSTHYLATKVAYAMGLKGPCVTVNNACSTGLTTIALACESLTNFSSDIALAGAITIVTPQESGYLYRESGILSPNGQCAVFDADAKGTVLSNGCGIVVLKRLAEALRDNDNILAVIKGWAINNDGHDKAGFTAPSVNGQVSCIKQAIAHAKIAPTEVEYVEAHGTGTLLGDPIEIKALTNGYDYAKYQKKQYCAIGSVKGNIGHTDSAAGTAGFIKAVLSIYKKTLPPNINYSKANEKIKFNNTPYYVNCEPCVWKTSRKKRTAAVNALGFGGTNAHIILQEAPEINTTTPKKGNVFIISAKTPSSLKDLLIKLKQYVLSLANDHNTNAALADMTYTLQVGRKHFPYRLAIPYIEHDDLLESITKYQQHCIDTVLKSSTAPKRIIFGFVGQGSQYPSMAKEIYKEHPLFKQIVDQCLNYLEKDLKTTLYTLLFSKKNINADHANKKFAETQYAQPALFIVEYALSQLLISLGIKPTVMIGHSIGEYVAATISGVFKLEDALKLIVARGRLMAKTTSSGAMLAVPLAKQDILPFLTEHIELAVHNAPQLCIVAGLKSHLLKFERSIEALLKAKQLSCQYLHTSGAFHSKHMDAILADFLAISKQIKPNYASIPYISNVTGKWINADLLNDYNYWVSHIRNTVLFSDGITLLELSPNDVFIEIGPGNVLSQLIHQHDCHPFTLHTLPHYKQSKDNSYCSFLSVIGKLWLLNLTIDWSKLYTKEIRKRASIPTYAFERNRHWIDANSTKIPIENAGFIKDAMYIPIWERGRKIVDLIEKPLITSKCWLIFGNHEDKSFLKDKLKCQYECVFSVIPDINYNQLDGSTFTIDLKNKEHYENILKAINMPFDNLTVIHTCLMYENTDEHSEKVLQEGPYSLLYLAQAFTHIYPLKKLQTLVVTKQIYSVLGNEIISPIRAAILGPCKVIPQEQKNLTFKLIDLECETYLNDNLSNNLISEANSISESCFKDEIAYRGNYRWVQRLQLSTHNILQVKNRLKSKGVYLITGGLGGIGLTLAQYLAKNYNANIILIIRTAIPPEDKWIEILNKIDNTQKLFKQITKLIDIKKYANSLCVQVDTMENRANLSDVIKNIKHRYKHIDGIIHAAGVAGGGAAQLKTIERYQKVLQPKLDGTFNLIDLLKDEPLDFFVFFSSITAITGFPGQIDYCSANRVLDAYAMAASTYFKHSVFCVSMNWQAWRDVGMAAESKTLLVDLDQTNSTSPHDGCVLFEKIVNSNHSQVVISNLDLNLFAIDKVYASTNHNKHEINPSDAQHDVIGVLKTLFCQTLGINDVGLDIDFYDLGGHSLLAINLLAKIRNIFNIQIHADILFKTRTIRGLSMIIQSYVQENSEYSPLVVLQQGNGSKSPLFIIHPVGGTVFCYLQLIKNLPDDITVYALQDPSIEHGDSLFSNIEEMATFYRQIIQKTQTIGPYHICGASFGASVTTEIAYQLLQENEKVNFVGLIDGWSKSSKTTFDINYVRAIIHHHKPQDVAFSDNDLDNEEIWEKLLQHRLNMMRKYQHKKLPIKLTLFKAKELLPEYQEIDAKDNHWSYYSTLPVDVFPIPGDHNTMLQDSNAAVLANYLHACIMP